MPGGALRRLLKRKLSMAFEKWQFEAAEMARSKYMMGGAIKRMLHRMLSMAWEKWQYTAAQMKAQQALLDELAQSMELQEADVVEAERLRAALDERDRQIADRDAKLRQVTCRPTS